MRFKLVMISKYSDQGLAHDNKWERWGECLRDNGEVNAPFFKFEVPLIYTWGYPDGG